MKTCFTPIIFTLALTLTGCGTKAVQSVTQLKQPVQHDQVANNDPSDIKNAAKLGELTCAFEGECEPRLALVSISTHAGLSRCSGFLISADEVMTNDHCVEGNLGADSIFVHFAALASDAPNADTGGHTVSAEDKFLPKKLTYSVAAIETRSGGSGSARKDYAILKLSEQVGDRAPVKISSRGFRDLEAAQIFRVQMTSDGSQAGFGGLQSKLNCQASYDTFLYPGIHSEKAPLMTFGDCAIQLGNSGSPVFNTDGDAGAIIQGFLLPEKSARLNEDLQSIALDHVYGELAMGTALHCLKNSECDEISELKNLMPLDFLALETSRHVPTLPKSDVSHAWIKLGGVPVDHQQIFALAPICSNEQVFRAEMMRYQAGLNRFLQFEYRIKASQAEATPLVLDFSRTGSGTSFTAKTENLGLELPRCQ